MGYIICNQWWNINSISNKINSTEKSWLKLNNSALKYNCSTVIDVLKHSFRDVVGAVIFYYSCCNSCNGAVQYSCRAVIEL